MQGACAQMEFEQAARIRDQPALLREQAFGAARHDTNVVPMVTPVLSVPQRGAA